MSLWSSATFFPSATVLMITPKPSGFMLSISVLSLAFSFGAFNFFRN